MTAVIEKNDQKAEKDWLWKRCRAMEVETSRARVTPTGRRHRRRLLDYY